MWSSPALLASHREPPFQQSFSDRHHRETSSSHSHMLPTYAPNNSNTRCESATVDGERRRRRSLQRRRLPRPPRPCVGPRFMQPPAIPFFQSATLTPTSTSHGHSPPITETEPTHVSWLWNEVMSYASDTTSSRGRSLRLGKTASTTSGSGVLVDTPSTSEAGSTRIRKEAAAKVSDADFATTVLRPCGIDIDQQDVNKNLKTHFRLPADAGGRLKDYQKEYPLKNVWLEPDMECIRTQYRSMGLYGSNEAEYSAYALRDIFVDEPLQPWLPEERGEDAMWLPVRMLQFVQKPPDDKWLAPLLLSPSPSQRRYAWDIRPDCAYYVSLQAFQSGFRPNVRNHVAVRQKRAFCSYLTIEFKKADDDTIITARHQVATASAIALYNRYLLKVDAIAARNRNTDKLEQDKSEWRDSDKHQMRHYGITFAGSTWDLWCTVPKTLETGWTGCIMTKIYSGDCSIHPGPARLVGIVNDIHYWGLHVHGRSCKNDIADKVHADEDADTEDITFFEEEKEKRGED